MAGLTQLPTVEFKDKKRKKGFKEKKRSKKSGILDHNLLIYISIQIHYNIFMDNKFSTAATFFSILCTPNIIILPIAPHD
jgi:hypothetical protein